MQCYNNYAIAVDWTRLTQPGCLLVHKSGWAPEYMRLEGRQRLGAGGALIGAPNPADFKSKVHVPSLAMYKQGPQSCCAWGVTWALLLFRFFPLMLTHHLSLKLPHFFLCQKAGLWIKQTGHAQMDRFCYHGHAWNDAPGLLATRNRHL